MVYYLQKWDIRVVHVRRTLDDTQIAGEGNISLETQEYGGNWHQKDLGMRHEQRLVHGRRSWHEMVFEGDRVRFRERRNRQFPARCGTAR